MKFQDFKNDYRSTKGLWTLGLYSDMKPELAERYGHNLFHYVCYLRKIPWFVPWGKTYEIFHIYGTYFSVRTWRIGDLGLNCHYFHVQAHSKARKMHITFLAMQMVFSTEFWAEAAASPSKYCQRNGCYNFWESWCYDFYKANL